MTITWTSTDGIPQEVDTDKLLAYEKNCFTKYVEKLGKSPSPYQIKKANKMLADIESLQKIIDGIASNQENSK